MYRLKQPVLLFEPKHRLGHPEKCLLLLSKKKDFLDQRIQKKDLIWFWKQKHVCSPATSDPWSATSTAPCCTVASTDTQVTQRTWTASSVSSTSAHPCPSLPSRLEASALPELSVSSISTPARCVFPFIGFVDESESSRSLFCVPLCLFCSLKRLDVTRCSCKRLRDYCGLCEVCSLRTELRFVPRWCSHVWSFSNLGCTRGVGTGFTPGLEGAVDDAENVKLVPISYLLERSRC